MNHIDHQLEHEFVINTLSSELFYVEGFYYSTDHITAVLIDNKNHPNLINWDEFSTQYHVFSCFKAKATS